MSFRINQFQNPVMLLFESRVLAFYKWYNSADQIIKRSRKARAAIKNTEYVEKDYDINFKLSIFESFLLILIAELGDKTFIMLIILQLKTNII